MAIKFNRSQTFATNGTVTAAGLHNLVDGLDVYQALITDQTALTSVSTSDKLLIADNDLTASDAPRSVAVQELFDDALTGGTFTNAQLAGSLSYGTATGNRTVSTSATITTGTINNATLGTTTGTAATFTNATATGANITSGTVQTLTSSTLSGNLTGGTFSGIVNSTLGTIGTLNSTTGTIGNLSTTLAGDLTISQGTATLGTSGVTASSYGTTSDIPRITVDAKGRITSATTVTAPIGFRNRIINGDMRIDQRNAGASVTVGSNLQYVMDRWYGVEDTDGSLTIQRSNDAPSGFSNSALITITSNDSSLSATQYAAFRQVIEGFNVSDLSFGSSSAKQISVSFWVKSSVTGTFGAAIHNGSFNRSYPFTYTINSSNTWELKSATMSGDTSGTWATDNSAGMSLTFSLGAGSTYSGTSGAWTGSYIQQATGNVNLISTQNATWQITGVQLEAGSTATDFERRPYGTELALCQRYYYKTKPTLSNRYGNGRVISTTQGYIFNSFPVPMRVQPTALEQSGTASDYGIAYGASAASCTSVPVFFTATELLGMSTFTTSAVLTVGHGIDAYNSNANGYMAWSAEL